LCSTPLLPRSRGLRRRHRRMPSARCRNLAKIKAETASLGIFRDSAF
jgi:hypothetical protein